MITNPRGIPIRLHLKTTLTTILREIRKADGYTFDLGQHPITGKEQVRCGVDLFSGKDGETLVAISESSEQGRQQLGLEHYPVMEKRDFIILVMGRTEDDRENPTLPADYLMADVKEKIAREMENAGDSSVLWNVGRHNTSRVQKSGFGDHFVRPPDASPDARTKFAYFWLPIWFELYENPLFPYITPTPTPTP